ncbi:SUMF1/EgtB/PvdO family nonheme iron enzyme [Skermanella pratensis]|uniref:SUMF1/EgtB/PvdO family nonheme iron enzyme n=1 Tax=Skermanella pratensis TaxID=2233999 RepID=UPI0013012873|nr:SUMF1/EgtB/PvdO family nonheme iron enzyme [Skermanella pratensis]
MRVLRFLGLLVFALSCALHLGAGPVSAADADKRIALVIGIGAYQFAPALPNPSNDARAIAAALRNLKFEVEEVYDLDNRGFSGRLRDFGIRAAEADVAVIFYAGHGLQVRGQNYLLPSDARLERERDLVYEAMPLNLILGELAQARKLGVLILDACRNNPFADRLSRSNAGAIRERDVSAGLSRVDDTPSDTLVALATRADALAEDGAGEHSPYTMALLKNLNVPGLELGLFFRRVRDNVMEATQGRQEPFIFGSLGATPFYFNPTPPNRSPELPALKPIVVGDTSEAVKLGIGRIADPDGDEVFAQVSGLPATGQVRLGERLVLIGDYLSIAQLSQVTYKPDVGAVGPAGSFDFAVMDNKGGTAPGKIAITVNQSNRPPVVAGERTFRMALPQLGLEAPSDPDGDAVTLTVAALPSRGSIRKGSQPVRLGEKLAAADLAGLTYDPGQSAPGEAGSFAILADDGRGGKATASVRIELETAGTPPAGPELADALWQQVRTRGQAADFAAYLQLFPDGRNAPLARDRLAALAPAKPNPPAAVPAAPAPPAKAEVAVVEPRKPAPAKPEPAKAAEPPKPEPPKPEPPKPEPAKPAGRLAAAEPPASPATRNKGQSNSFQDCPECPIMVRLPAGSFTMGSARGDPSEQPSHKVSLSKPFALGMFEVTVAEWRACVQGGGCSEMPRMASATDETPVHNVHWRDAVAYTIWLSKKTGQRYRLPSEAEWEYAARAGTAGRFWWGEAVGVANANCENCGGMYERLTPLPVGSFKPNPLGFYDMNGGVAEWVADCWNKDYRGAPADGGAWTQGDCRKRVLRGGSWRNDADSLSVTGRFSYEQDVRYLANGFRIARDLN